jgi:integrase
MPRRSNGEGTVTRRRDGRWMAQWTVRTDIATGRPVRRTVYGATRQEAAAKMREERERAEAPESDAGLTWQRASQMWLAHIGSQVEPDTLANYRRHLDPADRYFGARARVWQIDPACVAGLYEKMSADGLSRAKQVRTGKRVRQVYGYLVALGLASRNPASAVPLPRARARPVHPLTGGQLADLLAAARGNRWEALYWLAADTGARWGELTALTWRDVDDVTGGVSINKSVRKGTPRPTKTPRGRRRVPVTPQTAALLARARALTRHPLGLVFSTAGAAGYLDVANFHRDYWRPLLRAAGLPAIRFHDLRHTCASLLLLANVHPKVVSERLGHASIEITLNTYSHLLPTMQSDATAVLAGLLPS